MQVSDSVLSTTSFGAVQTRVPSRELIMIKSNSVIRFLYPERNFAKVCRRNYQVRLKTGDLVENKKRKKRKKKERRSPVSRFDIENNGAKVSFRPLGEPKQLRGSRVPCSSKLAETRQRPARKDCPTNYNIPGESNQSEEELRASNLRQPLEYKSRAPLGLLDE